MTTIPGAQSSERLNAIEATMRDGFARIEKALCEISERVRLLEHSNASLSGVQELRIGTLEGIAKNSAVRLDNLETRVEAIEQFYKGMRWLGGIVVVSVVGLIWALITGQAQVIFK
jgi:hypothetical protein